MDKRAFFVFAFFGMVAALSCPTAFGQSRDTSRSVIDVVHLKNQKQIRGFVLKTDSKDELSIAVSCGFYEKEDRDAYLKALENAKQGSDKAMQQLRDRLKRTLEQPIAADGQLGIQNQPGIQNGAFQFFLKKELERVDAEILNRLGEDVQFLILRIKSNTVSSLSLANDLNRKIAVWSWYERLADVETRKPSSLNIELKAKKIDAASTPPSLANRFYPVEESEDQWSMRLAIVSYRLDKPVEFQGSGESMFYIENGQAPDMASLMGQMMQSQMSTLLAELSGVPKKPTASKIEDTAWLQSAVKQAEKKNAKYLRATHVRTEPVLDIATVDSVFLVKLESGKWSTAWQANSVQSAGEQKEDAMKRVANDPQIQSIQTQFEALGGTGGPMDKAIRMGAATMAGQRFVNDEFLQFTERYLNRLSVPPIQAQK